MKKQSKKSAPSKLPALDVLEAARAKSATTYDQRRQSVDWVRSWEIDGITAGVGYVENKLCSVRVDQHEPGIESATISLSASARLIRELMVAEERFRLDTGMDDPAQHRWLCAVETETEV